MDITAVDIEHRILRFIIVYYNRFGHYPTIAQIAVGLRFGKAIDLADIVLASKLVDYTVTIRGEKSLRDDACNWTVEPIDLQAAYKELGKSWP